MKTGLAMIRLNFFFKQILKLDGVSATNISSANMLLHICSSPLALLNNWSISEAFNFRLIYIDLNVCLFFICVLIAGLCRTCEIFGASALVLDNLRHVSDKQFQSLSVSSELWLPLLEVTWIKVLILYTYLGFYIPSLTPVHCRYPTKQHFNNPLVTGTRKSNFSAFCWDSYDGLCFSLLLI